MADILDIDTLLRFYFRLNVSQKYMLELLAYKHQIVISRRTLQRKLKNIELYRKKNKTDLIQVTAFLQKQMEKSGCLHGYRWMYTKCCIEGLVVDRESVRVLLQIIDPDGVELRKSRRLRRRIYFNYGPNYTWHIDSNDKLKPFGIFINGCVDGFSRHIIRLQASGGGMARSIAYYFIEAVKCRKGCPRIVRTDMGVENTVLHKMQAFLRRSHQDNRAGNNSVMC
ncbi:hypothetical protein ACJMK2_015987 [Sinanodonta woodiana]|uniref:Integrase catalytic domain-containing protein n=1 Tax=Sinanodonta woodiana TaxID=1069815 RepID=A0ABD3UTD1_SINWO